MKAFVQHKRTVDPAHTETPQGNFQEGEDGGTLLPYAPVVQRDAWWVDRPTKWSMAKGCEDQRDSEDTLHRTLEVSGNRTAVEPRPWFEKTGGAGSQGKKNSVTFAKKKSRYFSLGEVVSYN